MISYIHLVPGAELPALGLHAPFRAVVVVESPVTTDWQLHVSRWLVQSGCLYMLAWGLACSSWDDSVDVANLACFDFGDIPDDRFVMTTWHDTESLEDVFWTAKYAANHPDVALGHTVIVHIAASPAADALLKAYDQAA